MKYFLLILAAWCCLALRAEAQSQFGDFYYTNDAVSVTITGRATSNQFLNIPSTINGLPVTVIGSNAFFELAPLLESVLIPNTVTNIEYRGLGGNIALTRSGFKIHLSRNRKVIMAQAM